MRDREIYHATGQVLHRDGGRFVEASRYEPEGAGLVTKLTFQFSELTFEGKSVPIKPAPRIENRAERRAHERRLRLARAT